MRPGKYKRKFRPVFDRLMAKIVKHGETGCWNWVGSVGHGGHGTIRHSGTKNKIGRLEVTHRVAWEHEYGPIPDGLFVLHKCDNPRCVRPSHLFLGTQADNMADMVKKKRYRFGTRHYRAKLTEQQVLAIRKAQGTQRIIAEAFGVCQQTIHDIKARRSWRDL